MVSDIFAILLSFLVAYLIRTHLDQRPFYFQSAPLEFVASILILIPAYIIILAAFGLYRKSIFLPKNRFSEILHLLLASIIGMMAIITYDFFFLKLICSQSESWPFMLCSLASFFSVFPWSCPLPP